jgi:outer membrane receptor protein involved in Fe transport
MNNVQLLECGLFRKSAVLLAIFFATILNVQAQEPAPAPFAGGARDAQGNLMPGASATAERVIVTGSNIPTAEEVGPNPVEIYNQENMQQSGRQTTEQFLLSLPIVNANVIPVSNNENGSNTAVGAATVALRGLDPRATLILIDGRRVAPYPIGNNPGPVNAMFVDLNSIPQAAIESIEILKDGASTVYGADAVAGVVNIKMRHYFSGAEAAVEYGNTEHQDAGLFQTWLTFGVGNKDTEISGTANYYNRNSIANRDRTYSAVPPFLSSNASPYNLQVSSDVAAAAGGQNLNPGGTEFAAAPDGTNGSAPASAYKYGTGRLNRFNFNQFSLSYPSSERYGGYTHFEHKVFEDQMVVYGDFSYENVKAHNELAAPATGSFQTAGQVTLAIPPNMPIAPGSEPPHTPTHAETGVPADAFNPFNPFNQIISGSTRARLAEFGNRLFDNETDAFFSTAGIKGDKLFDGTWGYDAGYRYSQVKSTQEGQQVSISKFNQILNQNDPIFQSGGVLAGQLAFNPFGDFRVPIPSNQATLEFARVHPKDTDTSKLWTIDGNIYTTSLFELPAGGLGFAVGGQFRNETLEENPDPLNEAGDIAGNSPVPTARGGRKSYAFYAEANIPIFSPKNAITGFRSLELTAAGRYEKFRNNDTDKAVPKFGIRWQPFEDLTLRATWGQGFREPSLEELFAAPISGLKLSHDPKNGFHFEPETNVLVLSNKDLQPEDSESYSAGFVYTPKYFPGLNFSVDFWGVRRDKVIGSSPADEVLDRELNGKLLPNEAVERDPNDNSITRILTQNRNLGAQVANGIDWTLLYQRPLPVGALTFLSEWSWMYNFQFQGGETAFGVGLGGDNLVGWTSDPGTSNEGFYEWRGNNRIAWDWKGFDLAATVRFISGFNELKYAVATVPGAHRFVEATTRLDLQASYDFTALLPVEEKPVPGYSKEPSKDGKSSAAVENASARVNRSFTDRLLRGTVITVGVNNAFDDDPPFAQGEKGNAVGYPGFTYDATNRFWYWRLTKKF